jgi:hypothetical protein
MKKLNLFFAVSLFSLLINQAQAMDELPPQDQRHYAPGMVLNQQVLIEICKATYPLIKPEKKQDMQKGVKLFYRSHRLLMEEWKKCYSNLQGHFLVENNPYDKASAEHCEKKLRQQLKHYTPRSSSDSVVSAIVINRTGQNVAVNFKTGPSQEFNEVLQCHYKYSFQSLAPDHSLIVNIQKEAGSLCTPRIPLAYEKDLTSFSIPGVEIYPSANVSVYQLTNDQWATIEGGLLKAEKLPGR